MSGGPARVGHLSVTVVFSSLAFCSNGADSGQLGKFWEPIGKEEVLVKGTQGVAILPELLPRSGEQILERNRLSEDRPMACGLTMSIY